MTGRVLMATLGQHLGAIHARAARNGLDALALSLLSVMGAGRGRDAYPWDEWYPLSHLDAIRSEARSSGLSPLLVLALIREESRFDARALSAVGARGLMQIMPATAAWISAPSETLGAAADDLFTPSTNIAVGCRYFDYLLSRFEGSLVGALAAYNGGEGRMAAWRESFDRAEDPLMAIEMIGPRETRQYVRKVLESYAAYRAIADKEAGRQ